MEAMEIQAQIDAIVDRLASEDMQIAADMADLPERCPAVAEYRALHARLAELDRMAADAAKKPTEAEVIASPEFDALLAAYRAYRAADTVESLCAATDALTTAQRAMGRRCHWYVFLTDAVTREVKRLVA